MRILLGGSPCTYWSIAQKNNRETEASGIGWELFKNYLIAKEKFRPDFFLYENNVSAAQPIKEQIKKELGVWDGTFLTSYSDVRHIEINSALVSAQNRQRFYVHNCGEVEQPKDRGILLKDVLISGYDLTGNEKSYALTASYNGAIPSNTIERKQRNMVINCIYQQGHGYNNGGIKYDKCPTLTASPSGAYGNQVVEPVEYKTCPNTELVVTEQGIRCSYNDKRGTAQGYTVTLPSVKHPTLTARQAHKSKVIVLIDKYNYATEFDSDGKPIKAYFGGKIHTVYEVKDGNITIKGKEYPIKLPDGFYIIRKLTVAECRRLQTIPDWYKMPCSDTQNYKMLGNGWTIEVIKHILSHIPNLTTEPIEVLSMYDGMSCARIALKELGANVVKYYATEIDKYAIQTTQANFPDTIQLGDAFQVRNENWKIGELKQ